MADKNSLAAASDQVRSLWDKHGVQQPLQFIGFCLSLLPIPVIQQIGQTLDRHLADKQLREELDAMWAAVTAANNAITALPSVEQVIQALAAAVERDPTLLARAKAFTERLSLIEADFSMVTERGSYQELVHSLVVADISEIVARDNSANLVQGSEIRSARTRLHASDNSQNRFHGTSFKGPDGSVGMDGLAQAGNMKVAGSSVGFGIGSSLGFGPGGQLSFGPPADTVTGNCPTCRKPIETTRRELSGKTSLKCPHCGSIHQFNYIN